MKGSIDQVEAFFSGISGVWGRSLAFFGTCWISFGFAIVCLSASWSWGSGFSFGAPFESWYLLPFAWTITVGAGFLKWWGILFVLYLGGSLIGILMLEADLFRSAVLLFVFQSLHTLLLAFSFGGFSIDWDLDGKWHPLLFFMLLMQAYAIWHVYDSWQSGRRMEMPP